MSTRFSDFVGRSLRELLSMVAFERAIFQCLSDIGLLYEDPEEKRSSIKNFMTIVGCLSILSFQFSVFNHPLFCKGFKKEEES